MSWFSAHLARRIARAIAPVVGIRRVYNRHFRAAIELERVLAYDKLQRFIRADSAARLLATLRGTAIVAIDLPQETASTDPADNVILATAASGKASHVVTGDKAHLLNLKQVGDIAIVTVKDAIALVLGQ